MPLVIIKVTGGTEAPTFEQKEELIRNGPCRSSLGEEPSVDIGDYRGSAA